MKDRLSSEASELLRAARAGDAMPAAVKARLRAAIAARIAESATAAGAHSLGRLPTVPILTELPPSTVSSE
jgi:hypothetical protein